MNIISINKLTYRYLHDFVFHNFSLDIKETSWVTIAGSNKSGKSTLVKILSGLNMTDNDIKINNTQLNKENLKKIRQQIGVVFENPDNSFIYDTVKEEMKIILKNLKIDDIDFHIDKISKIFNINYLLNKDPHNLSGGEKQKAAIACALVHKPKILLLDEAFLMIDNKEKNEILKTLKEYKDKENLTILNFTHDLEESFYSDRLIIINKGEIIIDGKPRKVMEYDRILNKLGIEIPFIVDLSIKLKLYGLLDEIMYNTDEMVNTIWK